MNKIYVFIKEKYNSLHPYPRIFIKLGLMFMIVLYIFAFFVYCTAPQMRNYFVAMSFYYGAMEAAPAVLTASICASLICDIAYKAYSNETDDRK